MVTLTIDGVEVSVERGTSILDAAQEAGVRIPTLCNDKRLIPYGACRVCMVEVTQRGRTRTMPACFNPARDGMEVVTQSPKLSESRRMQLMLLLRSHPLLCPSCDACGDCQLQNLVHEYEILELPFARESRYFHVDNESHFIRFNMNLCIKCGMCVRICDEIQGQNELSFIKRGMESEVSTDFGRPLNCEFCGQCVSICPVGAISSKWLVGTGREFELKRTDTICSFCGLGCTLTLAEKDNKVVNVNSPANSPNEGNLCVKGRYGWPYVYSAERLSKPLIRKGDALEEVGWDEALRFVADSFNRIKASSGPSSLAALGSSRLTNEEAYVFNRFVRTVLDTPHLDHAAGFAYRALVDGVGPMVGYPAGANAIREIRDAKVILLLGADLTETHPVAKNEVIVATGRHRAKAIVVDNIRTKLSDRAGSLWLQTPLGYEYLIANAMLKWIIDQGLFDKEALNLLAEGLDGLAKSLEDYTPERVAQLTGVSADLIQQAAKEYAEAPTATIILTTGMNRQGQGTVELAKAAVNLALVTGRMGKPACGVHVFGEKANSQGAVDMGLGPDMLPGFHRLSDDADRSKFEAAWHATLPKEGGLDARGILEKVAAGAIKGLYVVGENPLETYPERSMVEKALAGAEFLVVQDLFLTSTAQMAHAVLPVAHSFEKAGTYTSSERLVQRLKPLGHDTAAKTDLEVFTALAATMGKPSLSYTGPEQVMAEIAKLVDVYSGVSYQRLSQGPIPWPCVDAEDPGKAVLYEGGFPKGKAQLAPAATLEAPSANGQFPLALVPSILKFHSGSFSSWSPSLCEVCPDGVAEMNPKDIKAMGLTPGAAIKITAINGASLEVAVKRSRRAPEGVVLVPQHFSALKLNDLTGWDHPAVKIRIEKV
jgi:predicted molibdopterin-dependent oxidoreductase YjgC